MLSFQYTWGHSSSTWWCMYHVCVWLQKGVSLPAAWWGAIISYYFQHRAWKIKIYSNAIWCNSGRDMFQHKLDQYFGCIKQVIVIAEDIMIVGKKLNHINHDLALTTLLETARRCNVWLNYEKLQYKKQEMDLWWNFHHKWLQAW